MEKELYNYILGKFNSENTKGVVFKGNYVFVRVGDTVSMAQATTYNAWDTKDTSFVPLAETVSNETPFAETVNRSGWVKRYVTMFSTKDKDNVIGAMEEIRDYFFNNKTHTIDGFTFDFKVGRPQFSGTEVTGGAIYAIYYMDFFADMMENGYYGSSSVHKMALDGGVLQDLLIDDVTESVGIAVDTANDLLSEINTKNVPISNGVTKQFNVYYDSSVLLETILKQIQGKHTREQIYDYSVTFDGVTQTFELYMIGGSVVWKNGVPVRLLFNMVEV